jgi:molybdate transport system permease protein
VRRWYALLVIALLLWACHSDGPSGEKREVVVFAAASLRDALQEIDRDFAAKSGVSVVESFGGSNQLAQQLLASPNADIIISASEPWMDLLERGGRLVPGTRRTLLGNQLVLVAGKQSSIAVSRPEDLTRAEYRHLVLGNPRAVPAGQYAKEYLTKRGLWEGVKSRVLPMPDVRAALAQAELRSDVVAIVYASDVHAADGVKVLYAVPLAEGPQIEYPVALVQRDSRVEPEVHALFDHLASPAAAAVFERHGFLPKIAATPAQSAPGERESGLGEVLRVSLLVSVFATVLTLLLGVPLAYVLARRSFPGKRIVAALAILPLGLPPTAVGYLLLQLLADRGLLGRARLGFDLDLLFTWKGAVLASTVMAMPLVVRTARVAFEGVSPRTEAMARTLGHTPFGTFVRFTLPLARRGLVAATILGFLRSLGEFGATVLVAGSVRGKTQTLASAIFNAEQAGNRSEARIFLLIALVLGFVAIFIAEWLQESRTESRP